MVILVGKYENSKFVLRYAEGDKAGDIYLSFEYGKVVKMNRYFRFVRIMNFYDGSGEVLFLTDIKKEDKDLPIEELLALTKSKGGMPLIPGKASWPTSNRDFRRSRHPQKITTLVEKLPAGEWLALCVGMVPTVLKPHNGTMVVDGAEVTVNTIMPVWQDNRDDESMFRLTQRYADYLVRHTNQTPVEFRLCRLEKHLLPQKAKYLLNGVFPTEDEELQGLAKACDNRLRCTIGRNLRRNLGIGGEDLALVVRAYCS